MLAQRAVSWAVAASRRGLGRETSRAKHDSPADHAYKIHLQTQPVDNKKPRPKGRGF